jgi:hypothetical protein
MGLNDVSFVKGQGGLGRPLPGQDHISGIIFYTGTGHFLLDLLPLAVSKKSFLFQMQKLPVSKRIIVTRPKPQPLLLVTAIGANGDTVELKVLNHSPNRCFSWCVYQRPLLKPRQHSVAAAIAALINAGTSVHGYTATSSTATVTITARKGLGFSLIRILRLQQLILIVQHLREPLPPLPVVLDRSKPYGITISLNIFRNSTTRRSLRWIFRCSFPLYIR